jgi:ferredoxin
VTCWRISIDQSACVGSGTCASLMPGFFELDEEDRARPRAATSPPHPDLLRAAAYCPTSAIRVTDADTGETQVA